MKQQQGASLISAIFLITVMAFLGILMTQMTIHGNVVTINELQSARALLAAESGIDWALYDITQNSGDGTTGSAVALDSGNATIWFKTEVTQYVIDAGNDICNSASCDFYVIKSTGMAGGTTGNPEVQRMLTIQFMPHSP
ncbi:hypothetical protein D5085_06940 [Ectothiorhodospiraceae bacterium BW-2]|nr:hypothetical protein D5085_06940 [Ectothiorhodospiraceae bacterium BW-2]